MKHFETDVAIIGGGTSGLAASVAAAERGARVTVIEKASTTGGTGNMGMGAFAVESKRQKGMPPTRAEAFKIFMEYTHWRVDARLVREYIYKSADTIDWLEKMGLEFLESDGPLFPGAYVKPHCLKLSTSGPGYGSGAIWMKAMTDRAKALGVQFLLQTTAKKVLKEGSRVAGVVAEDNNGEEIRVKSRAVIIGTGGFGGNHEMIKKYTENEYGRDMFPIDVPGMMGEGIRIAWEAGAAPSKMTMQLIFALQPPYNGRGGTRDELAAFRQPNLIVNLNGERICNEEVIANTTFLGNAVRRQKKSCAFMIFDGAALQEYNTYGMHYSFESGTADNFDANVQKVLEESRDAIYVADSLDELAAKIGINLEGLRATVAEYNQACARGCDEIFNKNPKYLLPIKQPKFYAGKFVPSAYGSLGGIKINYKAEALDKSDDVIPGFYAVGVDANALYDDSYIYTLPGNTFGFALNSGRIAGENAAAYVNNARR